MKCNKSILIKKVENKWKLFAKKEIYSLCITDIKFDLNFKHA